MGYGETAKDLRRCKATAEKTGQRCRAWAAWNDPEQRCATHAGRTGGERDMRSIYRKDTDIHKRDVTIVTSFPS